jgi:serine kinase of HPr protein (carbohydrate metabolism regulator)
MALHATAVAVQGHGVLLVGPPGSGKSDLALRLLDRGAGLVADDRVEAHAERGRLWLAPPATIRGLLEVRGLGLVRWPKVETPVAALLLIDLGEPPARLPEPATRSVAGIALPSLAVAPFAASAPLFVELAVARAAASRLWDADGPAA